MGIRIYSTLERKKIPFETIEPDVVRMYTCGVTVYNKAHMGHAMFSMVFDIIRRYLEYRGYTVKQAMNYTDVDDKIIMRANQLGEDPFKLAQRYIDEFDDNLKDLNILSPMYKPRASQEIERIIEMVQGLIDKGFAYEMEGDVYFRVEKDAEYGKLSGRKLQDMHAGARIGVDERKEHPMDFALWKSAKPGEPSWDSPWGKGRPGWHIECSAMNLHYLGEQIDIHGGGNDLIFPHHENEIAQTESLTGKPFARYWIHNGMLQMGGQKMSKSLGNLITIEDFLAKHSADSLRLWVLTSDYHSPLIFNDDVIEQAERTLDRMKAALRAQLPGAVGATSEGLDALSRQMGASKDGFIETMDDDFNTAGALSHIYALMRAINQARADGAKDADLKPSQDLLLELTGVLGLKLEKPADQDEHPAGAFIELLLELRRELRAQKMYAMGDLIRNRLVDLGVIVEDSKEGSTWRWK
jgi:cysteinyl-tRNA synthetase